MSGNLVTVIDRTSPIPATEAAYAYVRENRNIGKVILEVPKVG